MLLTTPEELSQAIHFWNSTSEPVVIDTETNITDRFQDRWLLGISVYTAGESFYIPVGHLPIVGIAPKNLTPPPDLFMGIRTELLFHNAVFDEIVLERAGIKLPDIPVYCTMLMSHLIDEDKIQGHSLDAVSRRYVGTASVKEIGLAKAIKQFGWEHIPPSVMAVYAEQDARLPAEIYKALKPAFEEFEEYWIRERKISKIVKKMITKGVPVDINKCEELLQDAEKDIQRLISKMGFNPAKKSEAIRALYYSPPIGLGLPITHRTEKKSDPQINKASVAAMKHPIKNDLKEWSEKTKLITSYYRAYLKRATHEHPYIHAEFKQHGTETGRWSCADPNMHQIPRVSPIKKLFLAEEGKELWEIDYSNIEWRMGAVYSNETKLIHAFANGLDMHMITAKSLDVSRQDAKIGGFTWLFAGGWQAIVEQIGATEARAKDFIKGMRETYPKVEATKRAATATVEKTGQIKIWTGRKRHYNDRRAAYTAFNFLTQGGSFEIVKESMIKLDEAGFDIRNCVHDSVWLMVDGEEDVKRAERIMEDWTEEAFGLKFTVESKRLN